MGKRDKRVDFFIANAAPFAQPILNHLRELVHAAVPDVEETMKWSMPHFDYKGQILCGMAAFKKHCAFNLWKANLLKDPDKILEIVGKTAMGTFGQITSLKDLPSDRIIIKYLKEAAKLNKEGLKLTRSPKTIVKKELEIPEYFTKALNKNKKALKTFEGFSNTNKKEYVEWITEAKTEETRNKRLETSIGWMSEGKTRHWKYLSKKNTLPGRSTTR